MCVIKLLNNNLLCVIIRSNGHNVYMSCLARNHRDCDVFIRCNVNSRDGLKKILGISVCEVEADLDTSGPRVIVRSEKMLLNIVK